MKICVVGAVNYDYITTLEGKKQEGLGGILYSILPLAGLFGPESKIFPVTKVGPEHIDQVLKVLRPYKNVDTKGISINPTGTNTNYIEHTSSEECIERLESKIPPISIDDLTPFLECDAFIFMFISGFDVTLETIKEIREKTKALIFIDAHNLLLGIDKDGKRFPQPWRNWKEWAEAIDILQMNRGEMKRTMNRELKTDRDFYQAAMEIMQHGPSQIPITLGSEGSLIAYRENKEYYGARLPAIPLKRLADTTGCGDNFIAGYIYGYLKYKNPIIAAALGNTVAGINCEHPGIKSLEAPEETVKRMKSSFSGIFRKIEKGWKGTKVKPNN